MKLTKWLAVAALSALIASPTAMATDLKDMQVIGRALSFVEGGAKGDVTIAIVYADDAAGSKEEADAVAGILGGGLKAGEVTMKPQVVSVSDLGSAGSAAAIFVPAGMAGHYGAIKGTGKLTLTTDQSCAEAGACVVSVQSSPKVEIVVNRSAASAASVSFAAAFRMMIKEI